MKYFAVLLYLSLFCLCVHSKDTGEEEDRAGSNVPQVRKNVPNLSGSAVMLGTLYDGRTDSLLVPLNLWSPEVIADRKQQNEVEFSSTDFRNQEDVLERLDVMGIGAELKLSFMGGLIQVSGGAKYLHDEDLKENTVRSSLIFKSKTVSELIPFGTPLVNQELCKLASTGPNGVTATHVVTEVEYGLNGFMVFKKNYYTNQQKKEIEGNLEVVVKAIPQIEIGGSADFELDEKQTNISNTMSLSFYGDVLLDPPPSTFEDAIRVYQELPKIAKEQSQDPANRKVVSFTLTPITEYCQDQASALNNIQQDIIDKISNMVADFEYVEKKIHSLLNSFVAVNFPRFSSVLSSLLTKFSEFKHSINKDLQVALPKVRGSEADQSVLLDLLDRYSRSVFHRNNIQLFFNGRTKEIDSIYNILNIVHGTSIVVDDGHSGSGNKCLQDHEISIVHTLRVLPEDNAADLFEQTPVDEWNEEDKWFWDKEEVGKTGEIKRKFKQFYDDNRNADACFLISLDLVDPSEPAAELNVLKNGNDFLADFQPPPQTADTLISQERGWDNYKFTFEFDPNEFVNRVEAKYWADSEDQRREHAKSHFAEVDGSSGEGTILLNGLFPNTGYKVVFHLWTDAGKGASSEEQDFTTLPTSNVADFQVTALSSESVKLRWATPMVMGKDADITGYSWSVFAGGDEEQPDYEDYYGGGGEDKVANGETTFDEFEAIVESLEPAQTYKFMVCPMWSGFETEYSYYYTDTEIENNKDNYCASQTFVTLPAKLAAPSVGATTQNTVALSWNAYKEISAEAKFLHYEVRLESMKMEILTRTTHTTDMLVGGLEPAETYAIKVRTVTTQGISPYSDEVSVTTDVMQKSKLEKLMETLGIIEMQKTIEGLIQSNAEENTLSLLMLQNLYNDAIQSLDDKGILKTDSPVYFDAYREYDQVSSYNGGYVLLEKWHAKAPWVVDGTDMFQGSVFVAPSDGAYFFMFQAQKKFGTSERSVEVNLIHSYKFGSEYIEYTTAFSKFELRGTNKAKAPVRLTAVVPMMKGDEAWVKFSGSDRSWISSSREKPTTHFIGFKIV